jgi:hypothetical protein
MKKIIIASAITLMSASASSSDFVIQALRDSTVQAVAIVLAGYIQKASVATSHATTNARNKEEAVKIQNEVQEYGISGDMSIYLAEKVEMVKSIDANLSEEECIDVLVLASDKLLSL